MRLIPNEFHLLTQHWRVRHVPNSDELLVYGDDIENAVGKEAMGLCNSGTHEIVMRTIPSVSADQEKDTLLHEVLHAVLAVTGLDQRISEKTAEDMVGRLAPAILSLMRENPYLMSYLMENDCDSN